MTTLRDAAQQALEALQELNGWQSLAPIAASKAAVQAEINLSAALAEEALQRLTDAQQEIEAALAAPVQEPLGFDQLLAETEADPVMRQALADGRHWVAEQFYTTPPQRKPLTEEEIQKLLIESAGMTVQFSDVDLRLARAIETAHGIKDA